MLHQPRLSPQQRRALRLLSDAPHGCTLAIMQAHGIANAIVDKLVADGMATLEPGTTRAGTRRITVVWLMITDLGRRALAGE